MGILTLTRKANAPLTAAERRADAIKRRNTTLSKIVAINERVATHLAKITAAEHVVASVEVAEQAYAAGRVAVEMGNHPSEPIDTLRERRDLARHEAADAAQSIADHRSIIRKLESELVPLRTIQRESGRELAALVHPVLDEKLAALADRHEKAEAALRLILREEAILTQAFDLHAMANSTGEFRGSAGFADIRIPRPQHPAFIQTYPDPFTRGRALEEQHAAYHNEQRGISWEADRLIGELLHGDA